MLKILIVDDEPPARARLKRLLEQVTGCELVGEADSAQEALARIAEGQVDALLLDISMPGLDGMTLARQLAQQEQPPSVVFCTAWPDQALDAFECDAVDYLVKPVRVERLESALNKVARLRGVSPDDTSGGYLRSTVGSKTTLVPLDEVICLLAEDKYTTVFYAGGQTVINNSLVELEKSHSDRFLRVHRNALVAVSLIRGLDATPAGPSYLLLEGTDVRPEVSRRHLPAIRKFIKDLA